MAHNIDMVVDYQFGSTGKGLIAGWLAKRNKYDTIVCAYGSNAGHTYLDKSRGISMMTRQLPTGISSPGPCVILLGPGAIIDPDVLLDEIHTYSNMLKNKKLIIHPHAAIISKDNILAEAKMSKIGSTTKGVGDAMIERIRRDPTNQNIAAVRLKYTDLAQYVGTAEGYMAVMDMAESMLVEGAQGFSLSIYHGFYPYVTSRDVTPWQIAADCGLPFKWAAYIKTVGTMRTMPIRVNNRDGFSGPCYMDQEEVNWVDIGLEPELTTVTKLPRRLFTFSHDQIVQANWHCGSYWESRAFLNFANYVDKDNLDRIIDMIEKPEMYKLNPPKVVWIGQGPDDADVIVR